MRLQLTILTVIHSTIKEYSITSCIASFIFVSNSNFILLPNMTYDIWLIFLAPSALALAYTYFKFFYLKKKIREKRLKIFLNSLNSTKF
jgi:hypothetical protein